MNKYDLKPEESIFFDDREENVKAARELGMEAVQITSEDMLLKILSKFSDGSFPDIGGGGENRCLSCN